jgi:cytochrome c oxidase subunit 1
MTIAYIDSDNPTVTVAKPGIIARPASLTSSLGWFTSVDHKKIGIMYGVTAFAWFFVGGFEALLIRAQLAQPNGQVLSADAYNQVFTMHGTTMIFLFVIPLAAAFFNYFTPILIGAADVAFPRLNAFSFWLFFVGGVTLTSSFFLGGAPNGGWFGYAPNSSVTYSPGYGFDFWIWGLLITGVASTVGALNIVVTILNMRCEGMTFFRMPVFVWMSLVTTVLLATALPIITVALVLLMFSRNFGASFFEPIGGGDPVLWQHLFWLFGHPEVYIIILPSMGIVSEVLPVFARKPLFGYRFVVLSGSAIGFVGWGVWAHHMFSVGLGPVAVGAFTVATMTIAIPTGVKIFNWMATLAGGSIRLSVAMLYSIGFIIEFTIGGLSGVTHSVSPHNRQQTDTYYVVAHFHYVIFGGAVFGLFSALYYWWPKIFGYRLNERRGKIQFWTFVLGFNLTFAPMHVLGLTGMPRRIYTYSEGFGWETWNLLVSIGSVILGGSIAYFLYVVQSSRKEARAALGVAPSSKIGLLFIGAGVAITIAGAMVRSELVMLAGSTFAFCALVAGVTLWLADGKVQGPADPWDGRTLEWTISSPPPVENFDKAPVVHDLDDFWHQKYSEDEDGRLVKRADANIVVAAPLDNPHLPSPSFYPILASLCFPVAALGMIYGRNDIRAYWIVGVGAVLLIGLLYAWAFEPAIAPHDDEHQHDDSSSPSLGGDSQAVPALVASGEAAADASGESEAEEPS